MQLTINVAKLLFIALVVIHKENQLLAFKQVYWVDKTSI